MVAKSSKQTTKAKKPATKKPTAKKTVTKKPTAKKTVTKKSAAKKPAVKKTTSTNIAAERKTAKGFRVNEAIVYPAHGVGQIIEISEHDIGGEKLDLYVINFDKEKMVLRVPLEKAKQIGMRKLADKDMMDGAMRTLRGRARIKRTMWSRRAQEYEAKINSGDIIAISEVVRDLFRNENQPEQSYSERQLYEAALDRLSREVAAVEKSTDDEAKGKLETLLNKATSKPEKKPEE